MCRYVGIAVYNGLVEEALTFEKKELAIAYVIERGREYGIEETSDSLTWDTEFQLPARILGDEVCSR